MTRGKPNGRRWQAGEQTPSPDSTSTAVARSSSLGHPVDSLSSIRRTPTRWRRPTLQPSAVATPRPPPVEAPAAPPPPTPAAAKQKKTNHHPPPASPPPHCSASPPSNASSTSSTARPRSSAPPAQATAGTNSPRPTRCGGQRRCARASWRRRACSRCRCRRRRLVVVVLAEAAAAARLRGTSWRAWGWRSTRRSTCCR